ncbi:hypothetical protein [Lacrimispora sp.]|uniref:hypothetical protein n=1 Tax=Lacrimispora sp. TaxID=2719234 RepID=UPI0028AAFB1D|nr:hypothetical protein [Lacrimispora sp.]
MIVKQVNIDIEVDNSDINMETIIKELLEKQGFNVLGTEQTDISYAYSKHCNKQP